MDVDNWINLGSAILIASGTIFLGAMALKAIRQTNRIHQLEHRQNLINDIARWATDILDLNFAPDIELIHIGSVELQFRWATLRWTDFLLRHIMQGCSLERSARYAWPNLAKIIGNVLIELKNTSDSIPNKVIKNKKFVDQLKKPSKCLSELHNCTFQIINEIDKIRPTLKI